MQLVIIGNSAAGLSALEAFRKRDRTSPVTVITKESTIPYSRVLLPYYLRGKTTFKNLFIRSEDYYSQMGATCITDAVVKLLSEKQTLILENSAPVSYDRLLIATGSSPVKPPIPGLEGKGIHHLWTLADVENLMPCFKKGKSVVVLGSGFVSLQGAWAALSRGLDVTVVELLSRIMPNALDDHGAQILTASMKQSGVDLRINTRTLKVEQTHDGKLKLYFNNGHDLVSDFIIVGTGVRPNIDFLEGTGIEVDNGVVVNHHMKTTLPHVYAAGDVAQVPSTFGGPCVIHALWPTALETGRIAGACMAGENISYEGSLNMNVTQMFGITVASMGKFMDVEGAETWTDKTLSHGQYLKILMKDGVPVGATCAGGSELVSTLGLLRPLIREKISIQGDPAALKKMLAQNMTRYHQAYGKGASCAL
ncbi:Pyridine nucleotide-disulphide oxidoreductase [Desulfocicer vacuolatum DSM 3385]|uniref:Pyridine nucleotide-disulphide oxidoreductase n=1 Tax=Desulfocicer vacuolatum DSM 3385 TaxID=1121400 RepID=A0A1W2EIH3_9BACT|nr:FAD-dependent oxidoreductase [Desulfocicer vacuolatum]SMD09501.1 Pyridine nucleotide-disulphide oxidoreductase [Desulfocicer vacuolatum DSM 3385]